MIDSWVSKPVETHQCGVIKVEVYLRDDNKKSIAEDNAFGEDKWWDQSDSG